MWSTAANQQGLILANCTVLEFIFLFNPGCTPSTNVSFRQKPVPLQIILNEISHITLLVTPQTHHQHPIHFQLISYMLAPSDRKHDHPLVAWISEALDGILCLLFLLVNVEKGKGYFLLHFLLFSYGIVYVFLFQWGCIQCKQYHKVALLLWVTKA